MPLEYGPRNVPRTIRLAPQLHPGFLGRAIALTSVTRHASTDEVFKRGRAAARFREHVIDGQLLLTDDATIHALVFVAQQHVLLRERHALATALDEVEHLDDTRERDRERDGTNVTIAHVNDLRFVAEK